MREPDQVGEPLVRECDQLFGGGTVDDRALIKKAMGNVVEQVVDVRTHGSGG